MRTFFLLLALALVGVCAGAEQKPASMSQAEEPTYRGKSLGEWTIRAKSENPQIRIEAAATLRHFGSAAIPPLVKLLADKEKRVCDAAAGTLEHIGPVAIPVLVELLRDRDAKILRGCRRHLGADGPQGENCHAGSHQLA